MVNIFTKKFPIAYIGFSPSIFLQFFLNLPTVIKEYFILRKQLHQVNDFKITRLFLITTDKKDNGGTMNGHYFHQDLLIANRIFLNAPEKHVDIGSRIDGFVAHVACFRQIEILDIRPVVSQTKNILFTQADLTELPQGMNHYTDSISCLHTIEHFGLGRYGDTIDVNGHIKGLASIFTILKPGGKFYFSTPIGPQRIEFNAHRVFDVSYLLGLFADKYTIDHFHYVDDAGNLHENISLTDSDIKSNFGCKFGCGIFELTKSLG